MRERYKVRAMVALLALLTVTFSGVVRAQNPNGRLIVTVKDEAEAVVAGATITVTNVGTGVTAKSEVNETGVATFPQLAVGEYTVEVEAPNFQKAVYQQVKIEVGKE